MTISDQQLPIAKQQQLDSYLSKIRVSEDDPGFLMTWNDTACSLFADAANQLALAGDIGVAVPSWFTGANPPGQMSLESVKQDIVARLAELAGGRVGNELLAPNTPEECNRISARACSMAHHPFMQQVLQILPPGMVLAVTYLVVDRAIVRARAIGLPAPEGDGLRRMFQ